MSDLQWIQSGSTWALHRPDPLRNGRQIFQYIRWSESAAQYVDMHGADLGTDLEEAKRKVTCELCKADFEASLVKRYDASGEMRNVPDPHTWPYLTPQERSHLMKFYKCTGCGAVLRAAADCMSDFDPMYPNDTALAYKRAFVAGCEMGGLTALPDDLLSHAIDRSLGAGWPALQAGKAFAVVFFTIHKRRKARDGGLLNPAAYLLAAFESELGKHKGKL